METPWLSLAVAFGSLGLAALQERRGSAAALRLADCRDPPRAERPVQRGDRVEVKVPRGETLGLPGGSRHFKEGGWFAATVQSKQRDYPYEMTVEIDGGGDKTGFMPEDQPTRIRHLRPATKVLSFARGSAAMGSRFTPAFFHSQIVPSAMTMASREGSSIYVWYDEGINAWGMSVSRHQPRTRRTFAEVIFSGEIIPGPAFDPSFAQGSAAVDVQARRESLRRMADPRNKATPNERAMAQRQLAKLPKPNTSSAYASRGPTTSAGRGPERTWQPPWQTDARAMNSNVGRDVRDMNFAKKVIYEHALGSFKKGHSKHAVTMWGFDGHYNRGGFTAFCSLLPRDLGYAGEVAEAWWMGGPLSGGEPHEAVIVTYAEAPSRAKIVRIRGRDVADHDLWVDFDSFNANPFNESAFAARLNKAIEQGSRNLSCTGLYFDGSGGPRGG